MHCTGGPVRPGSRCPVIGNHGQPRHEPDTVRARGQHQHPSWPRQSEEEHGNPDHERATEHRDALDPPPQSAMSVPVGKHRAERLGSEHLAVQSWRGAHEEIAGQQQERGRGEPRHRDSHGTEGHADAPETYVEPAPGAGLHRQSTRIGHDGGLRRVEVRNRLPGGPFRRIRLQTNSIWTWRILLCRGRIHPCNARGPTISGGSFKRVS